MVPNVHKQRPDRENTPVRGPRQTWPVCGDCRSLHTGTVTQGTATPYTSHPVSVARTGPGVGSREGARQQAAGSECAAGPAPRDWWQPPRQGALRTGICGQPRTPPPSAEYANSPQGRSTERSLHSHIHPPNSQDQQLTPRTSFLGGWLSPLTLKQGLTQWGGQSGDMQSNLFPPRR